METGNKWVAAINRVLAFLFVLGTSVSCTQVAVNSNWQSELYDDNVLVGQIWDSRREAFIEQDSLWEAMESARYLLLGEKHDNPDHHALQLLVLDSLLEEKRIDSVVFEMLDADANEALAALYEQSFASLEQIKEYLDWDEEGWDWEFYGPLIETAYARQAAIRAGNITGADVGQIYGGDPSEFEHLDTVFDAARKDQLLKDIDESHCGMLPESQFPPMVRVQQARDFNMAEAMVEPNGSMTTLLIAGNYHVRQDLGVPNYLLAIDESLAREDIVSVAFLEVQAGAESPAEYLERVGGLAAYDYIWFTPAVSNEDYCASLLGS